MRIFIPLLFLTICYTGTSQVQKDSLDFETNFLEDQFYLGITYNFLINQPEQVNQRNLSYGFQTGFIKDMPITKDRKIALGLGFGYALNTYYSNLRAIKESSDISYSIIEDAADFTRSKFESHVIEIPFELRWRDATAQNYKFWRVYAGFKLGYVMHSRSKFVSDLRTDSFKNTDLQNWTYGLTLNLGYNTFNLHAYYGLNTIFKENVLINTQGVLMKPLRIGLIFYIL